MTNLTKVFVTVFGPVAILYPLLVGVFMGFWYEGLPVTFACLFMITVVYWLEEVSDD